jgi:hypothetical protein
VFAVPNYTAFRLELVLVPFSALGLALGLDAALGARARRQRATGEAEGSGADAPAGYVRSCWKTA